MTNRFMTRRWGFISAVAIFVRQDFVREYLNPDCRRMFHSDLSTKTQEQFTRTREGGASVGMMRGVFLDHHAKSLDGIVPAIGDQLEITLRI